MLRVDYFILDRAILWTCALFIVLYLVISASIRNIVEGWTPGVGLSCLGGTKVPIRGAALVEGTNSAPNYY